ncbi:unnamed protein product [Penicillium discolor]
MRGAVELLFRAVADELHDPAFGIVEAGAEVVPGLVLVLAVEAEREWPEVVPRRTGRRELVGEAGGAALVPDEDLLVPADEVGHEIGGAHRGAGRVPREHLLTDVGRGYPVEVVGQPGIGRLDGGEQLILRRGDAGHPPHLRSNRLIGSILARDGAIRAIRSGSVPTAPGQADAADFREE